MNMSAVRAIVRGLGVGSWLFLGASGSAAVAELAKPSIPQQVRETGGFERIVVTTYDPVQLSALVGRADLIVEASTPGGVSYLNPAETDIFTDYTFTVHSVIKNKRRPEFRAGHSVTIRRDSGVVVIDGRTAVTHENGFPPFNANEHYILFLTERPRDATYSVFGGPQGAFRVGERVTALAVPADEGADSPTPMTRASFLGEVRALLRYSGN
jgi:hypothetical protein